ncbi:MAG: ornithine carbamoyltransferase [Armatimonadetes bacterium]|nr:ornithine carbamoyltransferase [Armatimonadota bacterium]MDW8122306.1 ornithine carbamoyltransferase [Armatimonadota bacterium]
MVGPRLKGRHLLSCGDLSEDEVWSLFHLAKRWKSEKGNGEQRTILSGKAIALYFEKPSLRTRVTFDLAVHQLGGHPILLSQAEVGIGERESAKDVIRNLNRWVNGLVARVRQHQTLEEMAQYSQIPIINALSDREHPCQALADLFTLWEKWDGLKGKTLAFVGDGFNVSHSLLLLCAELGVHCRVSTPKGYEPNANIVQRAKERANRHGSQVLILNDPKAVVSDADAVYTDVWVSMGQEHEAAARLEVFRPFQVNDELLKGAKSDAFVLHCLPAHRGQEITDEVLDSDRCLALDQAENRLHIQKAILAALIGGFFDGTGDRS